MLRHITSTLTACALAGTVGVFAQEPAPAQPEKQQAPKVTLTGCVKEAKTTDGGTVYVLNDAQGGSAAMYVSRIAIRVGDQRQQKGGGDRAGTAAKSATAGRRGGGQSEGAASANHAGRIREGGC